MGCYFNSNDSFEYSFSSQLFQKLKDRIVGKVYVNITHDEVYVEITHDFNTWSCRTNNFTERYLSGWSVDLAAEEYLRMYKGHVISRYFKTEKRESSYI